MLNKLRPTDTLIFGAGLWGGLDADAARDPAQCAVCLSQTPSTRCLGIPCCGAEMTAAWVRPWVLYTSPHLSQCLVFLSVTPYQNHHTRAKGG